MRPINVTISSSAGTRRTISATTKQSIAEVISSANIDATRGQVMLNGSPVSLDRLATSLENMLLPDAESCSISIVTKQDNGNL